MNLQKSDFGVIFWCWVIHINTWDVKSDGFWLYLKTDVFKLLTWYVVVQVNSPATDLSVPPVCWGMGNSGKEAWCDPRWGGDLGGALLIDLTSVKDAGQWFVPGPSQCSPCSCWEGLLHYRSNVMCFCSGHFVLFFSCVWSAYWLPAAVKPVKVKFYNAWNLELSVKCCVSRTASWLVRKISLLASAAPNVRPWEVCKWELVPADRQ